MTMETIFTQHQQKNSGFTLIELLTTLVIVSLLIMVSYPLYTSYVIKTRRIQAEVALLDLASGLEQYYLLHQTYAGATLADMQVDEYTDSQMYQLEINNTTDTSYLLKAYPIGAQQINDICGVLSLNQLGQKMISGGSKISDCW